MKPDYSKLEQLLEERVRIIEDRAFCDRDPSGHLQRLAEISQAIAAEHERLKPTLPARLNHFLGQASYQKALAFIRLPAHEP